MQQFTLGAGPTVERFLDGLDPDQRAAVLHHTGAACVTASPGSGKTRVVCHRVAYLVEVRGVDPRAIFAMTYTKLAAREMDTRIAGLIGANRVAVKTFHSLAHWICRDHFPGFKAWGKMEGADELYKYLLADAVSNKTAKLEFGDEHLAWQGADVAVLNGYIGLCKANGWAPWTEEALALARGISPGRWWDAALASDAYALAEKKRIARRRMTFADLMLEAVRLLDDPRVLRAWHKKWPFVLVDEGQDNSPVQAALAKAIAGHGNLMQVGDDKQSLYGWSGASPALFRSFPADHGAVVLPLRYNYRSARRIVQAGNLLAARMRGDQPPMIGVRRDAGVVTVARYGNEDDEALGVAAEIHASRAAGAAWGDHLVLYRVKSLSRACEDAFAAQRIPYAVVGGAPFFERTDARVLVAYLRLARGLASEKDAVLSLKHPQRYLPNTFFDALCGYDGPLSEKARAAAASVEGRRAQNEAAVSTWLDLVYDLRDAAKDGASPSELLTEVVARTGYVAWLEAECGRGAVENDEPDRVGDVVATLRAAARFRTLDAFLGHVAQATEASAEARSAQAHAQDRVRLMSCHRSKGLESDVVFLVACDAAVMPHIRATDHAEELRIAFVAVTRARERLHVSHVGHASPYLAVIAPAVGPAGREPVAAARADAPALDAGDDDATSFDEEDFDDPDERDAPDDDA